MSYATPEGRITKKCLDWLNAMPECEAVKTHGNVYTAGEPDIDGCWRGRALKVEVKVPGTEAAVVKAVTPRQRARLQAWQRAGAIVGVVTSVDELQALLIGSSLTAADRVGTRKSPDRWAGA